MKGKPVQAGSVFVPQSGTSTRQAAGGVAPQDQPSSRRPDAKTRILTVDEVGDFYHKPVPRIRIKGKWLERAGFKPGGRVKVRIEEQGKIQLNAEG